MLRASLIFSGNVADAGPRWNCSVSLQQLSGTSNRIAVHSVNSFIYLEGGAGIAETVTQGAFIAFKNVQCGMTNNPEIVYVPGGYAPSCAPFYWKQQFEIETVVPKQDVAIVPTTCITIVNIDYEPKD